MKTFAVIRIFFIVPLLCAAWSFGAFAETPAEAPAQKPAEASLNPVLYQSGTASGKTAYVDMGRLFNEGPDTQAAVELLHKEMEKKMPERQALTAEMEKISKDGGGREAVKEQWRKILLYDKEVQTAVNERQNEVFTPIFESIEAAVKKFGAKNGYQVIYAEPREGAEDITAAVLKDLK